MTASFRTILNGPSVEELFLAARLRPENRKVRFTMGPIDDDPTQKVRKVGQTFVVDSIGSADPHSGNTWDAVITAKYIRYSIVYDAQQRSGRAVCLTQL